MLWFCRYSANEDIRNKDLLAQPAPAGQMDSPPHMALLR
jgi:hypothetical protein